LGSGAEVAVGGEREAAGTRLGALVRGHPAVATLARRRSEAVGGYADAACGLGWHERVVPLLQALAREQPRRGKRH
jgi:hypothetical protein